VEEFVVFDVEEEVVLLFFGAAPLDFAVLLRPVAGVLFTFGCFFMEF
jgi:hypothetical protein